MQKYNIFISHSWTYSDSYDCLINLLNKTPYLNCSDFSISKESPLVIYNKCYYNSELRNKIKNKMRYCNVVLVLAGVYSTYSESIKMEIQIAKELNKPIIAIEPLAAEKTSQYVKENATKIVSWNGYSIANAIKEYGR